MTSEALVVVFDYCAVNVVWCGTRSSIRRGMLENKLYIEKVYNKILYIIYTAITKIYYIPFWKDKNAAR